jgi:hypothetical protein
MRERDREREREVAELRERLREKECGLEGKRGEKERHAGREHGLSPQSVCFSVDKLQEDLLQQSCTKTPARDSILEARDSFSEARDSPTTPAHDVKSQARPSEIGLSEVLSHGAQMAHASQTASDSHDLVRALGRRVEELEAELSKTKTKSTLRESAQECDLEAEVAEERRCRLQSEEKVLVLEERVRKLEAVVEERVQRCEAADAQVEALKEKICWLLDNDLCL